MNNKIFKRLTVALATVSLFFAACEDDVSQIGNSITSSEVTISVDSISYNLIANTIEAPAFESRTIYTLLGSISVPEYGDLQCSYVTQFLPAESLQVPDSIKSDDIDSVKMILTVPKTYITGDSLALQQLTVYNLNKQLPSDITADFDPSGYYDPASPLAVKSYTLSGYEYNDSTFISSPNINVETHLPLSMGRDLFSAYSANPDLFVWPESFAKYWPGVYVTPSFGKGCVAPVLSTSVYLYYPKTVTTSYKDENGKTQVIDVQQPDSVCVLTSAPEVISNVNISYQPSQNLKNLIAEGKNIITTPGGYGVSFEFPAKDILNSYWDDKYELGVINNMVFSLPATVVSNEYGIGMAPALLMVKTSQMESFFTNGQLPDNMNSFTSTYSSETGMFTFTSMRDYIVDLRRKGADKITQDDIQFTLIPVNITTEDDTDPYTGATTFTVTSIAPYTIMPTMMVLDTQNSHIVFTYSNQEFNN